MAAYDGNDRRRFYGLLLVSLLVHALLLVVFLWIEPKLKLVEPSEKKIKVQLAIKKEQQAQPENKQEPQERLTKPKSQPKPEPKDKKLKPKDLSKQDPDVLPDSYSSKDVEASSNQSNKDVGNLKFGQRAKTKKAKTKKEVKQESSGVVTQKSDEGRTTSGVNNIEELEVALDSVYGDFEEYSQESESNGESEEGIESEFEVETFDEDVVTDLSEVGNTKLLRDYELAEAFVEDPFSDKESKEVKLINKYLKALQDTVLSNWINPLSEGQIRKEPMVEIIFELNSEGFIRNPRVKTQSVFPQLDASLIKRLHDLKDYKFPIHKSYLDKYKYIRMRWAGSKTAYEPMPFEEAQSPQQ